MAELTTDQWKQVHESALWLHSQRRTEDIQTGTLERLLQVIPHRMSFFDLCCVSNERLSFFNPISTTMNDDDLSDYYQQYELSDYVTWCFTSAKPIIYRDSDMISPDTREHSLIYQEWMKPLNIHYSMGCTIVHEGTIFGSITLFRSKQTGDFSVEDVQLLTEFNRHLGVHFSLLWPDGVFPDGRNENLAAFARSCNLTEREEDVMRLVAEGHTNREIGHTLFISESTVKKHVNALYRKLGIENRVQLMRLVFRSPRAGDPHH